jgi:gamma-glutamyltranspeptidase/glutathione hydrolase
MIMRDGPDAFYRGPIARLIDAEMRRSRTASLPGGAGLLTYDDLARYRPVWRQPLAIDYRGTTVLGTPPPSASMLVMEALQLLEGFDLAGTKHSSADHLHLFAEAQKLATADFEAYAADPAFEDVPSDVLLSEPYAARRRALIDPAQAGAPGPGSVQGSSPGPAGAPAEGHTLHVSVVDRRGNAVAVTCSIGTGFGSAVVAPGTGFLLNSTNGYFNADGHPNHAEPGKRPATAQTPLIVVRDGVPILVAGAAGGGRGPAAVAHAAVNVVDFGMTLGHAVDAARAREPRCCDLFVEQTRIPSLVLEELERRGHSVSPSGEYEVGPWVEVAGVDPRTRKAVAAADPRGERGAAGA